MSMQQSIQFFIILFSIFLIANCNHFEKSENEKPRVIATTDGEIDDRSSFIRFLLYTNDFDVEGIIATNSIWQKHGHGTNWILEEIDAYGKVHDNLLKHDPGYPGVEYLKSVVKPGNEDVNKLHKVGADCDTEGSDHIISILLKDDPRPVWTLAWGGTNTIAQALWRLKESYSKEDFEKAVDKIRIYAIAEQDSTIQWIKNNVPEAMLILDYQFMVINYQHEGHPYSDHEIFSENWLTRNIKINHGALGEMYPQTYQSEGDSPSFFHLINNGLRSLENPAYGGWGGRHVNVSNNFWRDAGDDGDDKKAMWRWLIAISNDFLARMNWCVKSFKEANHPPQAVVDGKLDRDVKPGEKVNLSAEGSTDPDSDNLSFKWWQYSDADDVETAISISNPTSKSNASFAVPDEIGKKIHIILEVTDDGTPNLKHYQRMIFTIH